jgi:hypothetical protein
MEITSLKKSADPADRAGTDDAHNANAWTVQLAAA